MRGGGCSPETCPEFFQFFSRVASFNKKRASLLNKCVVDRSAAVSLSHSAFRGQHSHTNTVEPISAVWKD